MIDYPLKTLTDLGIKKINIISDPINLKLFKKYLNTDNKKKIKFTFNVQKKPNGIAEAFKISNKFINKKNCILVLGDNIFFGGNFKNILSKGLNRNKSSIFLKKVNKPNRYGVYSKKKNLIIEKPKKFISNMAVTGIYFYTSDVLNYIKKIKPSARGELEITDLNNLYIKEDRMTINYLSSKVKWFDAGTHENLLKASNEIYKYYKNEYKKKKY